MNDFTHRAAFISFTHILLRTAAAPAAPHETTAGGLSRQCVGGRGAGGSARRVSPPAGPLQRGRHQRARSGVGARAARRASGPADRRPVAAARGRVPCRAPRQRVSGRFLFLCDPSIDATNWRAEQAIRPAVFTRKVCGGNRSRKRADTRQVLASIVRTARQRKLDRPDLITTMLRAPTPIVPDVFALRRPPECGRRRRHAPPFRLPLLQACRQGPGAPRHLGPAPVPTVPTHPARACGLACEACTCAPSRSRQRQPGSAAPRRPLHCDG